MLEQTHRLREALARGDLAGALTLANDLKAQLDGDRGEATQQLGAVVELVNVYAVVGDDESAADALRHATRIAAGGAVDDVVKARLDEATGRWHKFAGRYDLALRSYRAGLARLERSQRAEAAALRPIFLANIGDLFERQGRYPEALAAYESALPLLADARSRAALLSNKGRAQARLGAFRDAASAHRAALEIRSASGDAALEAESRVLLASALSGAGEFAAALEELETASAIYLGLPERAVDAAVAIQNRADVFRVLGQFRAAGNQYDHAEKMLLRLAETDHISRRLEEALAYLSSGRGALAFEADRYEEAIRHFGDAAGRFRRLDPSHRELQVIDQRLAIAYISSDRLVEAESIISTYVAGSVSGEATDPGWTHTLGALRRAEGRYDEAIALDRRAAKTLERRHGRGHPEAVAIRLNVAVLLAVRGRYMQALAEASKAEAARDELLDDIFATQSEAERLTTVAALRRDLQVMLTLALRTRRPVATRAAYELLLRRKAIVAEATAAALVPSSGTARDLRLVRAAIARAALSGSIPRKLVRQKAQLEATLGRETNANLVAARARLKVEHVAALMPRRSLLIEFVRADPIDLRGDQRDAGKTSLPARYLAFSLRAGEPDSLALRDVGDAAEVDAAVARWRSTITLEPEGSGVRTPDTAPPAEFLAGTLLQEMAAPQSVSHLVIATDGSLSRVPFVALKTADGSLLVEHCDVSVVDTGRDLIRWSARQRQATTPVVIGDVAYDAGPRRTSRRRPLSYAIDPFKPLHATAREATAVASLLGVRPLLRSAARERRVKRSRRPAILHLATHGFFLSLDQAPALPNPLLRSALALAGFNRALAGRAMWPDAEDGVLTAEDILEMSLEGTELVTLSACETGLGETLPNEGVFGLRRTLRLAGVRTVVMSLWKVPDAATAHLMARFYKELAAGAAVATALRTAQNGVRSELPDPWHWAGFVASGDPSPLSWKPPRGLGPTP